MKKMTAAEALDAARDGTEFGEVLTHLFSVLEKAIEEEKEK